MPYASTYGKKVYPYQVEELTPEEQAGIPMLTNLPKTAESAAERGQDVYFLSDRPETEQFLAEKVPEQSYKKVLRDVRATRPTEEDLSGMEAWKDFKEKHLVGQLGFDPDTLNPGEAAIKARDEFIRQNFGNKTKYEMDMMNPKLVEKIYKEAERIGKAEETKATWMRRSGIEIRDKFLADWKEMQKERKAAKEPSKEPLVPVQEGDKIVYRRRTEAVGKEAPISQLIPVIDEAGDITYRPKTQAVGMPAPAKGKTEKEKAAEKATQEEKEARTYVDREFKWATDAEKKYEYEKRLAEIRKTTPPEPPEEVLEYRELPKGTKIDVKNKEHIAVLRRLRREAEGEAGGDPQKARKIFNQKIEKKGWIAPMGIGLKVR